MMPEVTTVFNVEYETKRKFYYLSDKFIEGFKIGKHDDYIPQMERIYKIIDNRDIFLRYLTENVVSFRRKDDEYVDWWRRLRGTKLSDCLNEGRDLLREYAYAMNHEIMKKKFVSNVAVNAVYRDKVETGFIEDISDLLSGINDNDKYNVKLKLECLNGNDEENYTNMYIKDYRYKKDVAEKRMSGKKKSQTPMGAEGKEEKYKND